MTKKLLVALGCIALLASATGTAYGDDISFTFIGLQATPKVSFTQGGGVSLVNAPLLSINDSDTNNVFIVPGSVFISTGAAANWTAAAGKLSANFNPGSGIEVEVDSAFCVGGPVALNGICLRGILNSDGAYAATRGSTGSFQATFTVTYVSPWVPALFGDPLPWLAQGSDSFTTGNNNFSNGGVTDLATLGAGSITYQTLPEPGTLLLLGTGIFGLAKALRRSVF